MPTIFIENKPYEVKKGRHLLEVALSLGFNLPYFCWHPALGSVGACRQCAVKQYKDENDSRGRIVMACLTPADDGTRISIADEEVVQFRASIIELLMTNHPHDCPVCDEGGECHLQDMTVMTGHNYRRFIFKKRTFRNQYLGPFINHEMNRCITCYRCVRFYRDHADGNDLNDFAAHNHVYFGRHEDGILENEFSGNLIEVCPTGVFTDKTFKEHYSRKWDLQTAPSVCHHCALGCNIIPGERYGQVRRILNRYNREVNGYFICDRGRFGYDFVNSEKRIRRPLVSQNGDEKIPVNKDAALNFLKPLLQQPNAVIGIGSPRASLESNYALRALVGPDRFFNGMAAPESRLVAKILTILKDGAVRSASLHDVELADAVLVLGEDLTNTAPMLALAVRQAVRQQPKKMAGELGIPDWHDAAVREAVQEKKGPLFIATPAKTKLDDVATQTCRAAPGDIARLAFAVANELNASAPAVPDLPAELAKLAREIAKALKSAERPVVISGTSMNNEAILEGAVNVAQALSDEAHPADLCYVVPECNSLGLAFFEGQTLDEAFELANQGEVKTAVILENNLYRRKPGYLVDKFLETVEHIVVLDHLENPTTSKADLVLPVSTFAEGSGTLVNNEGRAQRFFKVFVPEGQIQESWRWIRDGHSGNGKWENLDDILNAMVSALPELKRVKEAAPGAGFRIAGQKIAREEHRYSGRTSMYANKTMHEPKPVDDPDSPLAYSMEGYRGTQVPSSTIPYFWAPAWNSVQATTKFQIEAGGPLRGGDPGVRLLEGNGKGASFFTQIPGKFEKREGQWLLVPLYHIFGSEELSVLTPGLAERVPKPYVAMHPEDAKAIQVEAGGQVQVALQEKKLNLRLVPDAGLPRGVAGLPVGLPDLEGFELPTWSRLSKGGGA